MKKIVLIGAGGFGREVYHIIENYNIVGYIDKLNKSNYILSEKILGDDDLLNNLKSKFNCNNVCVTIGNSKLREKLFRSAKSSKLKIPKIINSHSFVASNVEIGEGSIIYPGAVLMDGVKIGKGVLINSNVTVGHDSSIGDFCNINPGTNIAGKVKIGNHSTLGIGSSIREELTIGNDVIIGGGSMVTKNINDSTLSYGVPSKPINKI